MNIYIKAWNVVLIVTLLKKDFESTYDNTLFKVLNSLWYLFQLYHIFRFQNT